LQGSAISRMYVKMKTVN